MLKLLNKISKPDYKIYQVTIKLKLLFHLTFIQEALNSRDSFV